jgi:Domain of unknown function (DUF4352)
MAEEKKSWFARHKIMTGILVLIAIGVVASAAGGGKDKTSTSSNNSSSSKAKTESKPAAAKIGTAVRDGKFEFTVTSIECGKTSVGSNPYLTKTAQGQYCLLNMTVKNIGDKAQSLFSANQKVLNASGQEFSADDVATTYQAPEGSTWYSNINPGNSVTGAVVFDVPKDQTPATAELHDSAYSGGAKVSLQ